MVQRRTIRAGGVAGALHRPVPAVGTTDAGAEHDATGAEYTFEEGVRLAGTEARATRDTGADGDVRCTDRMGPVAAVAESLPAADSNSIPSPSMVRRMHDVSLITTVAAAFTAAWLLGLITQRLGLSPIVGYLVAGVLIGPHTPGYIGDLRIAQQLAEVGVILLMFGVGLHFHLKDLLAVKSIAIPGAIGQSLVATVLGVAVFAAFDVPLRTGAVLGMAMAVASTVVLMRVLMDADVLETVQGHVAVGWLIVEDILTVILLVLIPVLGGAAAAGVAHGTTADAPPLWTTLGLAVAKLLALVAIVMLAGSRVVPWVLVRVARLRSRELFTLTVLVFSVAVAAGSYYFFGASMALGAFLAGMVVAQSPVSHQAAADALPMRDAFAVLFFVSVGMLFDPMFVVREPLMTLAALAIILVAKPLAALLIVAFLGHPVRTALTVALGLAQIGEFSFILSDLARQHGLMSEAGHNLLVAAAILSISLNPALFRALPRVEQWMRERPRLWALVNGRAQRLAQATNQASAEAVRAGQPATGRLAVVIGYGPVGRTVRTLLHDAGVQTVVVDLNIDVIRSMQAAGQAAIFGDAANETILEQAGVRRASHVILTLPSSANRTAVVAGVRSLNPAAHVFVRAHYLRERDDLERAGASAAVFEEAEAAVALARLVLADTGVRREAAEQKVRDLRLQLIRENIANIRTLHVRSIMIPWTRVRRVASSSSKHDVLAQISRHRYTRWPVVEPPSGRVIGYLLAKDLLADTDVSDWTQLIRPLHAVRPDDDIESTLQRMQRENATLYLVADGDRPLGLITLEDILEQVVGRIEDEYPHEAELRVADAVAAGGVVMQMAARTAEQAIRELAEALPAGRLPPAASPATIAQAALSREADVATDLGGGVAVPHARCAGLDAPLIVLGRSADGILFSSQATELVRLVFLLVTPLEQPEVQLTLLARLAAIAGDRDLCERLSRAPTIVEILDLLSEPAQTPPSARAPRLAGRPEMPRAVTPASGE